MDDKIFRELRKDKIAEEILDLMNDLLMEANNEREFLDLASVWMQVLGATLATLDGTDEGGWKNFTTFLNRHLEAGYEARRKSDED